MELVLAIQCWTRVEHAACALDLAQELMPAEGEEKKQRYTTRNSERNIPSQKSKRLVIPSLLRSRMEVAVVFDEQVRATGWQPGVRLPYAGRINSWMRGTGAPCRRHRCGSGGSALCAGIKLFGRPGRPPQ